MYKYVLSYETQIQIESEWGTTDEVLCFESDKSLDELKAEIKAVINNNDKNKQKLSFRGLVLVSNYNHNHVVYCFKQLNTLDDWFQLNKRIP